MPARSGRRGPSRIGPLVGLLVLAAVLAGCRTEARVDVRAGRDGSGTVAVTVTLDAEAADRLGDPSRVALDDLGEAGWRVRGPAEVGGGGLRWVVRRPFDSPADLARALGEVGGEGDGAVFRGVRLRLADGFGSTTYRFDTDVSLTGDLAQLSDPDLAAALGGVPLGWTPEELEAAGAADAGSAELVVAVELPGGRPRTDGRVDEGAATWRFPLSGGVPTERTLATEATDRDALPGVLAVAGAALLVAGLVVAAVAALRSRRR